MNKNYPIDIPKIGLQVLETVYIINNTKDINIVISRYNFLLNIIGTLKLEENEPEYTAYTQMAVAQYNLIYNTRSLQDYQLEILSKPKTFDLKCFYCKALLNSIKRYCEEKENQINSLKSEDVKDILKTRVIDNIKTIQVELKAKCSSVSFYDTIVSELIKLETTF